MNNHVRISIEDAQAAQTAIQSVIGLGIVMGKTGSAHQAFEALHGRIESAIAAAKQDDTHE